LSSRYGLEIRAAGSADAPGLFELLSAADHSVTPRVLAERLGALRQEQGAVLIALERGPPSGLIVLHWYRTLESGQPVAQISTLLVSPDKRRRGIGRLLVKAAARRRGSPVAGPWSYWRHPSNRRYTNSAGIPVSPKLAPVSCGRCARRDSPPSLRTAPTRSFGPLAGIAASVVCARSGCGAFCSVKRVPKRDPCREIYSLNHRSQVHAGDL
jgi:GNAT superfamily N-acetyltransferase